MNTVARPTAVVNHELEQMSADLDAILAREAALAAAHQMGAEDARLGVYSPTALFHFDDRPRIAAYDRGHASVASAYTWRWSDTWPAEAENEAIGQEISTQPYRW